MIKKVVLLAAVILILSAIYVNKQRVKDISTTPNGSTSGTSDNFLDSTPLENEVLAAQPVNITINFNSDLTDKSTINVSSLDGADLTEGAVLIEDSNTAIKKDLKQGFADGEYKVEYRACFLDNKCTDGKFNFTVDSTLKADYKDLRGMKTVNVDMQDFSFHDAKIMISPGTKVVWKNSGDAVHFVNTETHPEHTYFQAQNSLEIKPGETFSVVFDKVGQYNYHCSAHVPEGMLGSIVVSN